MDKFKNLAGQKFGRLTAIKPTRKKAKSRGKTWECLCDCGKQYFVRSDCLKDGNTRSCGCLAKDLLKKRITKHGMSKTLIYKCWTEMIQRCENPNDIGYEWYGARGIKVCERWKKFENFYADVGDPPKGMTLDRWPDNDGDYEPTNFCWATPKMQATNRRFISCGPCKQRWFFAYNESTGEWDENNNQREFAKKHNLRQGDISACLNGKQKTCKGWVFQQFSN